MPQTATASSEDLLAGLAEWVRTETPTTDPAAVNGLMDMAEQTLRDAGAAITRIPGIDGYGDNLIARTPNPSNMKPIVIACHLDTVWNNGTLETMPFKVDGDKAHGPGIYDMKAGSFLACHVLSSILRQKVKTRRPITLLLTPDEEVGSPTSRAIIEREAQGAATVLIMEPAAADGSCVIARKGVGRFVLEVAGKASHAGSAYTDGASAVVELAHQILAIEALVDVAAGITLNVGPISGGTRPNVIAEAACCEIDLRVPDADAATRMEKAVLGLRARNKACTVTVTGGMNRPPFAADAAILGLYEKARALAKEVGIDLPKQSRGGGSDGNFTAALGIPTLDGLGCPGTGAHAAHEHIQWRQLGPRAALLASLLETLE
ncbi:MAG: M20 family metallopeptidase [Rhodospirillales bacterium]|nr:M20 family metallopeptidase [Rhodospirillales bacterium]